MFEITLRTGGYLLIDINTEILPTSFRWSPTNPVTGTTKFYVRVAEELAKRGHTVTVFYDGPEPRQHNGVLYLGRVLDKDLPAADLQLDCNIDTAPSVGAKRFQWTSFFNCPDRCVGKGYDRLFLVSEYVHSTLAHVVQCPVTVLELGCDMRVTEKPDTIDRPEICAYTSSPDRGGTFLKSIWPEVREATGYELEYTPYGSGFSTSDVGELLDRSRFWLFPAIGTDSILSALEAQARGCIPFVVPHMGLPETLRYGVTTDLFRFKEDLIKTLKYADVTIETHLKLRRIGLAERPIPTWADVARKIEEVCS